MITIHATKKLLTKLKIVPAKEASASRGRLGPWYADVRIVNRKHVVYLLDESSLLCVVVPWTAFKDDPVESLSSGLRAVLEAIGIPNSAIDAELSTFGLATFTTTASRVAVGRLISAAEAAEFMVGRGVPPSVISVRLAAHFYSAGKGHSTYEYLNPYELAGAILGHRTRSPIQPPPQITEVAVPDDFQPSPAPLQRTSPLPTRRTPPLTDVVVFRIVLDGIRPEIWRMVLVPVNITLRRLHDVFQAAMGWDETHLHLFIINGKQYGDLAVFDDDASMKEEKFTSLQSLHLSKGDSFTYVYDMGDNWSHTVTVVETASVETDQMFMVLDGENAVPPEDVGGTHGYAHFVLAMMDPKHPDHEHFARWYGRKFDHTMFDLRAAARLLSVLEHTGAGYPWRK